MGGLGEGGPGSSGVGTVAIEGVEGPWERMKVVLRGPHLGAVGLVLGDEYPS